MTTLEEILQEHLINEIFPSFCDDHKKHLTYLIRLLVADWLTKKRQIIEDEEKKDPYLKNDEVHQNILAEYEELLEELKEK